MNLHLKTALFRLLMNLRLNEYSESIQLLIHKDSYCLSSISNISNISNFQYYWSG